MSEYAISRPKSRAAQRKDVAYAAADRSKKLDENQHLRRARLWLDMQAARLNVEPEQVRRAIRCRMFPEQIESLASRSDFERAMVGRSETFTLDAEARKMRRWVLEHTY